MDIMLKVVIQRILKFKNVILKCSKLNEKTCIGE